MLSRIFAASSLVPFLDAAATATTAIAAAVTALVEKKKAGAVLKAKTAPHKSHQSWTSANSGPSHTRTTSHRPSRSLL